MAAGRPAPAPEAVLRGHEAAVNSVAFVDTPGNESKHLLSGSADGYLKLWDLTVRRPVHSSAAHSKAGILQVCAMRSEALTQGRDGFLALWDMGNGAVQCRMKIACGSYTFTKAKVIDDNLIVSPLEGTELIGVFDVRMDCTRPAIKFEDLVVKTGMCMAIDLIQSDTSDDKDICVGFEGGHLARYEIRAGKAMSSISVSTTPLTCLASSGRDTLCGSSSNDLYRVQWPTLSSSVVYHGKNEGYGALTIRSDDRIYASGGWDNIVRIFHYRTDKRLATLKYHTESVFSLDFSHDCSLLASGSKDKKIALWSIYSTKQT